ncbi:hypothetical protein CEUSTIGMA_g7344.t1 [Chlamydomonas eustigma]|uniref:HMA domain-containing protein n=1 Tax=Chlamydomonas eustigma TaxID=1157962 RepID=A0A250XA10_9CHLO|nr:hypothetical protein CEUSTIGMA_g7344.t1 [Chlamydomonas eustigma]|eukprot:GAX79904.1 hypothetical protein CEUSTIGMA_g7344.t1 [Chlamydomonas eustigma]
MYNKGMYKQSFYVSQWMRNLAFRKLTYKIDLPCWMSKNALETKHRLPELAWSCTFLIPELRCEACAANLKMRLEQKEGVGFVKVHFATKEVFVTAVPCSESVSQCVSPEDVQGAIIAIDSQLKPLLKEHTCSEFVKPV